LAHACMGDDLRARVQTLARLRRGRIGVSYRWDSSNGTARDDYLICYRAPAALVISANSVHFARAITSSAPGGGHRPEYARYFSGPTLRRTRALLLRYPYLKSRKPRIATARYWG